MVKYMEQGPLGAVRDERDGFVDPLEQTRQIGPEYTDPAWRIAVARRFCAYVDTIDLRGGLAMWSSRLSADPAPPLLPGFVVVRFTFRVADRNSKRPRGEFPDLETIPLGGGIAISPQNCAGTWRPEIITLVAKDNIDVARAVAQSRADEEDVFAALAMEQIKKVLLHEMAESVWRNDVLLKDPHRGDRT